MTKLQFALDDYLKSSIRDDLLDSGTRVDVAVHAFTAGAAAMAEIFASGQGLKISQELSPQMPTGFSFTDPNTNVSSVDDQHVFVMIDRHIVVRYSRQYAINVADSMIDAANKIKVI